MLCTSCLLWRDETAANDDRRNGPVGIVGHLVANQRASVCGAVIRDWHSAIWSDDIHVKVHEPVAAHIRVMARDSVRSVTSRAGEARIDVDGVLRPGCILHDIAREVVTLAAHAVRPIYGKIGIRIQVGNTLPRTGSLTEFIAPLQDVGPLRTMRAVRPRASEFPIVIAVMAIGAENLVSHQPSLTDSVQFRHISEQT